MKIGIVGGMTSVELILQIVKYGNQMVDYVSFPLSGKLLKDCIDEIQNSVDAVIFTGYYYFDQASDVTVAKIPWAVARRTTGSIIATLLKAKIDGCEINRITFNLRETSEEQMARTLQENAGLKLESLRIYRYNEHNSFGSDDSFVKDAIAYHLENLSTGKASYCISGQKSIINKIQEAGYKAYWIPPVEEEVLATVNSLIVEYNNQQYRKKNASEKISVIIIHIDYRTNEKLFDFSTDRLKWDFASKRCIFSFAQRLGASIEEDGKDTYVLYSVKRDLLLYSHNFTDFDFIGRIKSIGSSINVSVGIGIGITPQIAKSNAIICRQASEKGFCDYFFKEDEEILQGPFWVTHSNQSFNDKYEKVNASRISKDTGVGETIIERIIKAQNCFGFESVTPGELARMCNMSVNNMNRVISKLESARYAQIIGMKPNNGSGRPSRIIKLMF